MTTLAYSDFAGRFGYHQVRIRLHYFQEDSGRTGSGDDITADLADPVWKGGITIDPRLSHAAAAEVQARIEQLDGVIGRFYMCDPRLPYPIGDRLGAIIIAHTGTPAISAISADRQQVKFKGLPANYWLNIGDNFHTDYGASPVRRAYHRIITRIKSDASGNTGWITVRPFFNAGQKVNDLAEFKQPSPLWRLVAGGFDAGVAQGQITPGGSLKIVQVV